MKKTSNFVLNNLKEVAFNKNSGSASQSAITKPVNGSLDKKFLTSHPGSKAITLSNKSLKLGIR